MTWRNSLALAAQGALPLGAVWHVDAVCSLGVLVSIGIWLEGQTPFLPAWSLGVCAGIKPCCCTVACGSGGLQARGLGTNSNMLPPFLEIEIYLSWERDAKPGCGWPSRDSIWEVKGFLAFPLAETSPAAVSLLPVLSVLNPSPFPPWPSSWAWSCSSGELRDGKFFFSLILNGHKTKLSLVLKRWCQVNSDKYWKTVALSTCLIFLLLPLLQQMKQVSKESIACIFSPKTLAVKRLTEISQHNWTTIQFS